MRYHFESKPIVRMAVFIVISLLILITEQSCTQKVKTFGYTSSYYKIELTDTVPFVRYFSVDGLGKAQLDYNPVKWEKPSGVNEYELRKVSDTEVRIFKKGTSEAAEWTFKFGEKQFTVSSVFNPENNTSEIDFRFDQRKNHTTLLGLMPDRKKTELPAVLHLPDMGTFQVTSNQPEACVHFDASRKKGNKFVSVKLPAATSQQSEVIYTFTVASIYPDFPGAEHEKYDGYRRNYLNLFQVNPRLAVIANNSASDPCALTLFMPSILALYTPPLAGSLTALDLLRMSVERYIDGMKAYGMVGYTTGYEGSDAIAWDSPYNSLDTYPSLVIAACNYIRGSKDLEWARRNFLKIKEWMEEEMKHDNDKNGLVEYELSGNSGSWNAKDRPANWWDTVGYGHEDAFSNALTYEALNLISATAESLDLKEDATHYKQLAEKLKNQYFKTFFNPKTGVLAGWRSEDGNLHDYYFVATNSVAIYFGLVPDGQVKSIMTTMWNKMQEVGFTNFKLGIPGNLIPIPKADYTNPNPRWGGGIKEDGSDAFQQYENGGASLNWTYFTLKALRKAGLTKELQSVTDGLLDGINAGDFQGAAPTGDMTKDWKTWNGECWGYEGYLCDGYLMLLALNPNCDN